MVLTLKSRAKIDQFFLHPRSWTDFYHHAKHFNHANHAKDFNIRNVFRVYLKKLDHL